MQECERCGRFAEDAQECCAVDGGVLSPVFAGPALLDGTYRLERRLRSGGMGFVAVAEHVGLRRKVAVKMIRPERLFDAEAKARFRVEAAALGQLEHPNIVRVTDFGIDMRAGAGPYLVMELLDGVSLRDHLDAEGALEPEPALAVLRAIAAAVDFAHERGILHRDLKPENVFLAGSGELETQVRLLDLGLARPDRPASDHDQGHNPAGSDGSGHAAPPRSIGEASLPSTTSRTGELHGTLAYMAPELLTGGAPGRASDVYAFAVLAFEILTGERPFKGSAGELMLAHTYQPPRPPSHCREALPQQLDAPLLAALAKQPEARPASAHALVEELEAAMLAFRRERWLAEERPRRLRLAIAVALAVLAVTAVLAAAGVLADLERSVLHTSFTLTPPRPPDPRLLLIAIDEATLAADTTPLIERADEAGELIEGVIAAGAQVVGLDLLLPAQWGTSTAFSRLVVSRPDRLVLALAAEPNGALVGGECVHGMITAVLGADRAARLFALVNLDAGRLGRVLRMRRGVRAEGGHWYPTFAARLATLGGGDPGPQDDPAERVWIDYRADVRALPRVSWADLAAMLERSPAVLEGRVVLIGQESVGSGDVFRGLPHPAGGRARVSGLELQALMTSTLLRGAPLRSPGPTVQTIAVIVVVTMLSGTLLAVTRPARVLWLVAVAMPAYAIVSVPALALGGLIVPVATVLVPALLTTLVCLLLLRRLEPYP